MQKKIKQHDENDCGAACLAEMARLFGYDMSVAVARDYVKTDRNGTTLYGITRGAEKIGIDAQVLHGSKEELEESLKATEIKFPFIAHMLVDESLLHFAIISEISDKKVNLWDPASGKKVISKNEFYRMWTGYIITFAKTDAFKEHKEPYKKFEVFQEYLKGQYKSMSVVLILSLLITGIGISSAYVFKYLTDQLISEIYIKNTINLIFVGLLVLYIVQSAAQMIRGTIITKMSRFISEKLAMDYFTHVIDLKISGLQSRTTGDYMSRMSDIETIRNAVSGATVVILLDTVMIVIGGTVLWNQNPKMFVVSLLVVLVYIAIVALFRRPLEDTNRKVMECNAEVQSFFKESIDGIEVIKAVSAEKQVKFKAKDKYSRFQNADFRNNILNFKQDTLVQFVEMAGVLGILWLGFNFVIAGKMTMGELIAYYILMSYFTEPVKNLMQMQPELESALIAAERLQDVIQMPTEERECGKKMNSGEITFDAIGFRYGGGVRVLDNFSLHIKKGEKVAIVGESGSGKTTIAKLLLKYYDYEEGEIYIDKKNLKELATEDVRKKIAYVSQDNFFFSDSIYNNLILGNPEISKEKVMEICQKCEVDSFVRDLPMGYDTILEENASNLSGGQKQRLAIARALIQQPDILIMDESTSHLDAVTESKIKNIFSDIDSNMTLILIAHRLNMVKDCDNIVVLEDGRVSEMGKHQELLQNRENYYKLWKHQSGGCSPHA